VRENKPILVEGQNAAGGRAYTRDEQRGIEEAKLPRTLFRGDHHFKAFMR
jgi:hypothetical protein